MIEILIVVLLLVLIFTVIAGFLFLLLKKKDPTEGFEQKMQVLFSEKFLSFQDSIYKAMDGTRAEVERSKDLISSHALKTLDTIKDMGGTLEKIIQDQQKSHELGESLKYLLQTPKLRGSYGEVVLEEMLERILPKGVWQRQYAIDGQERVDAVVVYKDVVIPIDAKFPREIYEKYLNADNPEDKRRAWKLYEDGLKVQINSIKTKYVKPQKGTSDFALMFIPSESIYYETIAEKNFMGHPCNIYEYARANQVVPVSPNTFYAFLQIIIMGIRNLDIIKSAKKLQEALARIEKNFNFFYTKYQDVGTAIDRAQDAYKVGSTHVKRFKDNIDSTLRLELPDIQNEKKPPLG